MGTYHPDVSDEQFLRAKDKVDAEYAAKRATCTHEHHNFAKHGRFCTCGELMVDFGD